MTKFSEATPSERRSYLMHRLDDLKTMRAPWLDRWRQVSNYISPYDGRFEVNDHQESRNYDLINDNEAGSALQTLVSGLSNGATTPARQWFKVNVSDPSARLDIGVARWCSDVEHMLMRMFQISNTYNSLHDLYREICLFGVGVDLIYDDPDNLIRHHVLPAGEYCIAANSSGEVDTLYREFEMTVKAAVDFFGYNALTPSIKSAYDDGKLDEYHTFCHAIEPRTDRDLSSRTNKNMPWASYYFQTDDMKHDSPIIQESGFRRFPALCPRWTTLAGEVYGLSPAMVSLPNVKQLQQESYTKSVALELMINPPLQAPASLRQEAIGMTPGAISFTGGTGLDQTIKPVITTAGDIQAITQDIMMIKNDVKRDFFVDLFMMINENTNDRKTAAEIAELRSEKMLVLGSVMERLQHELLAPLVNLGFDKLRERGLLPQPPSGITSPALELEFQSMLAQSQRAVDINAIDRLISSVQAISASQPEVLDRVDIDGLFDVYMDRLAADPRIARTVKEAQELREARQQQMEQQQQVEQGQMGANAINQLMQAQKAGAEASAATQNLEDIAGGGTAVGGLL